MNHIYSFEMESLHWYMTTCISCKSHPTLGGPPTRTALGASVLHCEWMCSQSPPNRPVLLEVTQNDTIFTNAIPNSQETICSAAL